MAKTKYRVNVRKFLNRPGHHAGAYVIAKVEDTSSTVGIEGNWHYPDIALTLSDCTDSIDLSFSLSNDSYQNSIAKVTLLIETLMEFRKGLSEERALYVARRNPKTSLQKKLSKPD